MFETRTVDHDDGVGLSSGQRTTDPAESLTAAEWESLYPPEFDEHLYQLTCEAEAEPADDGGLHVLPADLESIPPGIFLAAFLSSVDRSKLSGWDVVRLMQARHRQISHTTAHFYADVNEMAHAHKPDSSDRLDHPAEFASEELQAGLRMTRRAADHELGYATDITSRLPTVWQALEQGRIDPRRARVFSDETFTLRPQHIPQVVDDLIDTAEDLTTGQLRSRLKKLVIAADPETAEDNFEKGVEDRRMVTYPNPNHTGTLAIQGANPLQVLAASEHVRKTAMNLKRLPGETRTLDQICADVALDLLQGKTAHIDGGAGAVAAPRIVLQLPEDSPTVDVPGYGPILTTSLTSQQPLNSSGTTPKVEVETTPTTTSIEEDCPHETPGRRPTKAQQKHIRQTYPTCVFPGCRMPAIKCDIDHRTQTSQGGKTTCKNLAPLCRHHHICKDQGNWKLERLPDGTHRWTSPLGHVYTRGPP